VDETELQRKAGLELNGTESHLKDLRLLNTNTLPDYRSDMNCLAFWLQCGWMAWGKPGGRGSGRLICD
jgi:hypothetical protein